MTCIIAYDIEDNKIRSRLSHFLEKGGIRLQKSVFAVKIERHRLTRFLRQIEGITHSQGKVAVFRMCIGCQNNAIYLGKKEPSFHVY
jgi:CRISPR-associated endonuclease Cas2